tara:strand:+ start:324 stop:491 length:168 start_codon:yes stop_codon:yes gene_type:complete
VSKIIKKLSPKSKITSNLDYPRSGAFEIKINNKIAYSKFKTKSFPSTADIQQLIK